jgi:hypothetical protein
MRRAIGVGGSQEEQESSFNEGSLIVGNHIARQNSDQPVVRPAGGLAILPLP